MQAPVGASRQVIERLPWVLLTLPQGRFGSPYGSERGERATTRLLPHPFSAVRGFLTQMPHELHSAMS